MLIFGLNFKKHVWKKPVMLNEERKRKTKGKERLNSIDVE